MGGKTATTTQGVSIPPEVMQRYNAVNARAEQVAEQPFQQYGGEFVAPLTETQQLGVGQTIDASQMAQPYYGAATESLYGAQAAAQPGISAAYGNIGAAQQTGAGYAQQAAQAYGSAAGASAPYYQAATQGLGAGLQYAAPLNYQAANLAQQATGAASPYYDYATSGTQQAVEGAQQYQQAATEGTYGAQAAAQPYYQQATQAATGALGAAQPMQGLAAGYLQAGAQGISPQALQTAQYMSPFTESVVQATQRGLGQQQAQQLQQQQAEAIRSGAFGGDRAGLQRAALMGQQNLATAQAIAPLYQQAYNQALQTAGQQQGVQLSAEQANRAAQQQAAQQAAALGQQGYSQQMGTAQQLAALGQGLYGQGLQGAQQLASLGQQGYQQRLGAAQQMAGLGQALYGQGIQGAQTLSQLGQTGFGQQLSAAQQAAALGQALYGQGMQGGQAMQSLGQQQFGQGTTAAQQLAALSQQQYGMGAGTSQQLAALGAGAQQAGLQGAQAVTGAGTLEQQTQQAQDTAQYQQFLQERGYPFQVAQFLANIAMGTGALSGSTTTTTQPAPFFSDRREKTNIQKLGKGLYAYDYKSDVEKAERDGTPMPPKRVGPMAQDIEKKKPGLVVDVNDYKVVNPDRAERAYGGGLDAESMGGAVMEPGAFAPGGLVAPEDMRAILAAQAQFLGPHGQGGLYGGSQHNAPGGKGFVPAGTLPVAKLAVAARPPAQQPSTFSQLAGAAQGAQGLGESLLGEKGLFGEKGLGSKLKSAATGIAGRTGLGAAPMAPASPPPADIPSSDTPLTPESDELTRAAGGLIPRNTYATSGAVMPYGGDPVLGGLLEEEDKEKKRELPKPGQPPGTPRGLGNDIMDAARLGSSLYGLGSAAASAVPAGLEFLAALPFFSDRRLKHNIDPVGETYDGQQIYRYDMGDGRTQLGLMAQEVARHKPDAVGSRDGYLTLDYDRATEDAVPRMSGGLVPRHGYAEDGWVAPRETAEGGDGTGYSTDLLPAAIREQAKQLGISPHDLATAISFETGGTFDPWQKGPTTKWGQHRGLIQWGEPQRQQYGITEDMPVGQQMQAVAEYLRDRGVRPGMGLGDIYSAINAGQVGRPGAVDMGTTVAQKVASPQMARHRQVAAQFLGLNPGDIPAADSQEAQSQRTGQGMYIPGGQQPSEGGLSGFAKSVLPTTKAPSGEESINWKQTLIPVLTGLGAMASSPSRYLGSAILQGLGAGAQSYAGLEKQQSEIERSRAQTIGENIENVTRSMPVIAGVRHYITADGRVLTASDWRKAGQPRLIGGQIAEAAAARELGRLGVSPARELGRLGVSPTGGQAVPRGPSEGTQGPGVPSEGTQGPGVPSGGESKPGQPSPMEQAGVYTHRIELSPEAYATAEREGETLSGLTEADRNARIAKNISTMNAIRDARERSRSSGDAIGELSIALTGLSGPLTTGSFFEKRQALVSAYNTAVDLFGFDKSFRIASAQLSNAQIAEKVNNLLQSERARGLGQHAFGALEYLGRGIPNPSMNQDAITKIIADMMVGKQQDLDKGTFAEKYQRRAGTDYTVGEGINDAFYRQPGFRKQDYENDKRVIAKLLQYRNTKTGEPLVNYLMGRGKDQALQRQLTPQAFDKKFGTGISRYFYNVAD